MPMTERGAAVPQDAQITPFGTAQKVTGIVRQDVPNGGYACASYASGGGSASRIAGDVSAGSALASCRADGLCAVRGKAPLFDLLWHG